MADDELPNYLYATFTLVIGLILLLLFYFKLNLDRIAGNIQYDPGATTNLPVMEVIRPATKMIDVCNPFTLKLSEDLKSNIEEGVYCKLSCLVDCNVQCYWAVDIPHFYHQLRIDGDTFAQLLESADLFQDCSMCSGKYEQCDLIDVHFTCPETDIPSFMECLGSLPRSRYPLIIIQYPTNDVEENPSEDTHVIAMVTVFHLKDVVCKADSHVVAQFLKLSSGQVLTLKQLYVVSSDQATNTTEYKGDNDPSDEGICSVCQTTEISRAILPCRHACVCDDCFIKVYSCPICRGDIESYFLIRDSVVRHKLVDSDCSWWERLNNKLNNIFAPR